MLGIIQARMSSSRLPGKVLMAVAGKPLLGYLLERVRPARAVDRWVVATSDDPTDDAIDRCCASLGVGCFRGDLHDVLDRYYRCASGYQPDAVVRITADCPLHHFGVVDAAVRLFQESGADYFTNSFPPMFEDGVDTEVLRFDCLERAWRLARAPHEREHVTSFLREDSGLCRIFRKLYPTYDYKLSVDQAADFEIVSRLIEWLYPRNPFFTMDDVMRLLEEHPTWRVTRLGGRPVVTPEREQQRADVR